MQSLTRAVLHLRWLIVIATVVVTAVAGSFIPHLQMDVSIENLLDADDPDVVAVRSMLDKLGGSVPTILAYRDPDLFTPEGLARLDKLTQRIREVEWVARATSLTSVSIVSNSDEGVWVRPLIESLPETQAEVDAIREVALSNRLTRDNLVGAKGDVAAVVVNMTYVHGKDDEYAPLVVDGMREAADEILGDREYHFAGLTIFYRHMLEYIQRDLVLLGVAPTLLIAFVLFGVYRNIQGVVLPLLVVGLTLVLTLGLMGALGVKLGVTSVLLPPLLLVIGCADAVHIVTQVAEETIRDPSRSREAILEHAMGRVGLACLLTSVTTTAGFASLAISSIRTVREFGIFAAVAIMLALVLSLTLLPVLLRWWRPNVGVGSRGGEDRMSRGLRAIADINLRHPKAVLFVAALAVAWAAVGIPRIRIESGFKEQFKSGSPILASLDFVQEHLSGPELLAVFIENTKNGSILEPATLVAMNELAEVMRAQPNVRRVDSVLDYLIETRRLMGATTATGAAIPTSRAQAEQLMLLLEMGDEDALAGMITGGREAARIQGRINSVPTSETKQVVDALKEVIARHDLDGVQFRLLGPVYFMQRLTHELIDSQIKSFGLAFVAIFFMMVLALRSVRLALISMVPNLLPIGVMLGVMGWFDVPLNDVTIMTASVAIGIAVDDTIHYLVRFRLELNAPGSNEAIASVGALMGVGRALTTTSVVLAAGFIVTTLASFNAPIYFGLLSTVTIVVALIADLFLLPVLLVVLHPLMGRDKQAA